MRIIYLCLTLLLLTGCTPVPPLGVVKPSTPATRAVTFLHGQYNPSLRLLRESPIVAPGRHWLATDNQLASYALGAADDALAAEISQSLAEYGGRFDATRHGVIEALTGEPIAWPPRTHTHNEFLPGIWHEERITGETMLDWADYADLALYGALDAWNRGDADKAHSRYAEAMTLFDGVGFDDAATDTHYATYKLALALFVGKRLNEDARPDLLAALLAKQDETGGFVTIYNRQGEPEGDACRKAIWRYMATRPGAYPHEPLFATNTGQHMERNALRKMVQSCAERAGVDGATVHRWRHTFAINYLRNGGNVLELARLMGHSRTETLQVYVDLAQTDLQDAQRRASPADNWRL